jgi:2-polyprenyl-3-methyl-5-hydroxy-6-metoxy-1,4-benzoquinol methylase
MEAHEMTITITNKDIDEAKRDAFAERLLGAALGMFDIHAAYLGDRLGYYRALADGGPATSVELAKRTNTNERYTREWLEHQAVGGVLDVASPSDDASAQRYALPREHAEVLLDRGSLNFMAPIVRLIVGAASPLRRIVDAYRSGDGVPYAEYGADLREGQGEINMPPFLQLVGTEWLPAAPAIDARLKAAPPARVADLGAGAGWSSIGIARAYPNVRVDGFDLDPASVALAKQNLASEDVSVRERVSFALRDAGDPAAAGAYDQVTIFEALHDMAQPVAALMAAKAMLAPGGSVLVVDERVAEQFTAPGDEIERLMYGWSFLHCLPAGMADQPSAATGTVMRPDTLRVYANDAGFSSVEVLPVDHLFFRFYVLTP